MTAIRTWAKRVVDFLAGRLVSACVMTALSLAMIGYVMVNLSVFTVVDGDKSHTVTILSRDPADALLAAGVSLSEDDDYEVEEELLIDIDRAINVRVTVDGSTSLVRLTEGTVADALELAGITLNKFDRISVSTTSPVEEGMNVLVERVKYEEYTVEKTVEFETIKRYTNTLKKGKKLTIENGKNGKTAYTYRKCIVDGKVVDTVLVGKKVVKEPVNRVVLVGTVVGTPMSPCPFDIELDEAGQPVNFKKLFTESATAYFAPPGKGTSIGMKAQVGVVAVDPRKIPYRSKLYIVSPDGSYVYGYAIAGDTGGAMRAGKAIVDLYMNTYEECCQFGRRKMNVYILEYPDKKK